MIEVFLIIHNLTESQVMLHGTLNTHAHTHIHAHTYMHRKYFVLS